MSEGYESTPDRIAHLEEVNQNLRDLIKYNRECSNDVVTKLRDIIKDLENQLDIFKSGNAKDKFLCLNHQNPNK